MNDFESTGFFDVNGFVDNYFNSSNEFKELSTKDLTAVKASKKTWADLFEDDEE